MTMGALLLRPLRPELWAIIATGARGIEPPGGWVTFFDLMDQLGEAERRIACGLPLSQWQQKLVDVAGREMPEGA